MSFAYDTWGKSWGTSWAKSWGVSVVPPPADLMDMHDGLGRETPDYREEARSRDRDLRNRVRETVEASFRRVVEGEQPTPIPVPASRPASKTELRQLATVIRSDVRTDGVSVSLQEVQALVAELQTTFVAERLAALALRKRREDEALVILMLMM